MRICLLANLIVGGREPPPQIPLAAVVGLEHDPQEIARRRRGVLRGVMLLAARRRSGRRRPSPPAASPRGCCCRSGGTPRPPNHSGRHRPSCPPDACARAAWRRRRSARGRRGRSRSRAAPCRTRAAFSSDPAPKSAEPRCTPGRPPGPIETSSPPFSLNCLGHEESFARRSCCSRSPPFTLKTPRTRQADGHRSLVRHLLDHRLRSGDQRARRRGAVARVRGRRRGAVREARRRRGGDAGVGEPSVRSQGDRAARAGTVAGGSRQADHRRRSRPRHAAGGGDRRARAAPRSTPASASSIATPIRRISCTSAATPATSPVTTSRRRATRSRATRSSRPWPPRIRTARARWPSG